MKYVDFYTDLKTEAEGAEEPIVGFIQTNINNGIKVGFFKKGDSTDRIRESRMRVAYKTKIHNWLIAMDEYLFKKLSFEQTPVEIIFSMIPSDDNEHGDVHAFANRGENKFCIRSEFLSGKYKDEDVIRILIHEWSHIWHYAQSSEIDNLIEKRYDLAKKEKNKNVSNYGMTNHYEFWSYLIESYDKLDEGLKKFVDYTIKISKS